VGAYGKDAKSAQSSGQICKGCSRTLNGLSKKMIIALIGGTCVGKTSIMRKLKLMFNCNVRSCGERVLEVSKETGISLDKLSDETHREIDLETVQYCKNATGLTIVDGRYLHYVLASDSNGIFFVQLTATAETRAIRCLARSRPDAGSSMDSVSNSDARDQEFCGRLYTGISAASPNFVLDTDSLSIDQCGLEIKRQLELIGAV
jgi:cytidylate kinase